MFDLDKIKFIKSDDQRGRRHYSFVGIQRNEGSDKEKYPLEFWLPLGFNDFDETDFDEVKKFFFKMYRTFKTYLQKKQDILEENDITINRDGIIEKGGGFSFTNENKEQTVFYGKLNSLDKILEGYDELRISSLEKKQIRSYEIDYSKLHRYLHQAVYLDDDVVYLDEMNIAKNVITKSSPRILQLFCFIYVEIKTELEEFDNIPIRAIELAEQFKEEHLQPNSHLFGEKTFAETVNTLKEKLETIDIETTYKDEDFWHFFEAVEAFLYGERQEDNQGIYWGFSSFYDVWEDMCQTYVFQNNEETYYKKEYAFFADVNGCLVNIQNSNINPFELKLNNIQVSRYLKPDLVIVNKNPEILFSTFFEKLYQMREIEVKGANGSIRKELILKLNSTDYIDIDEMRVELIKSYNLNPKNRNMYENVRLVDFNDPDRGYKLKYKIFKKLCNMSISDLISRKPIILENLNFVIVDYKYMRIGDYERYSPFYTDGNGENKVKEDIHKQLVYEWTIQQNWQATTQSEFWIPFFSKDTAIFKEIENIDNPYFNQSQIKVFKINFKTLQEFYIKQTLL